MEDNTLPSSDSPVEATIPNVKNLKHTTFVVSCLHPSLRRRVRKNIGKLKAYYSEIHKLYCDILDLTKETKVTETSLKIVLDANNAKESVVAEALKEFHRLDTMTEGDLNIIKERLGRVLYSASYLKFFNGGEKPKNEKELVDAVNKIKDDKLEIDDEAASDRFIRRNKMTEINVEDALASLGSPIRSSIPQINKEFTTGGYIKNQLIDVVAAPSCLTGDTKILCPDCGPIAIEELYERELTNFNVCAINKKGKPQLATAEKVQLMRMVNNLVKITTEEGLTVKCTPDHLFLTTDQKYLPASELTVGSELKALKAENFKPKTYYTTVSAIEEITLDEPVPVYDIINVDKFSNFAICGDNPHSGIFVHNCGKSLFMQNEVVSFIAQGYKVIYVALGDLNEIDFITRLCALIYNKSMSEAMLHVKEYYGNLIRDYKDRMDNLELLFVDPDTITIDELQDYLYRMDLIKPGNILMIDYDTNFKTTKAEDNIYEKGNEIFTVASAMSKKGKFDLVFIASQPKIAYYDKEIISQEAASESSRKSQIVDVMITIGKNPKSRCPIGCINLAKVRRGGQKTWFYYALDPTGKFIHIDRMTYMDAISREDFVPKNCDADLVRELYSDLYSPHISKPAEETDSVF